MIDEGATYRAVAERYGVTVQAAVWAVNYSATARGVAQVSDEERAARREAQLRKCRDRMREYAKKRREQKKAMINVTV
jgi:hypothetical protein